MQSKLTEQQFNGVVIAALPTYYLKLNQMCIERCAVNLADSADLTEQEAACVKTCARAYTRMTKHLIGLYETKCRF